jgi:DNA polymerase V
MSLFQEEDSQKIAAETEALEKEKQLQQAVVALRQKFGKNAVLKGINLEEGATAQERNRQIGGHKA